MSLLTSLGDIALTPIFTAWITPSNVVYVSPSTYQGQTLDASIWYRRLGDTAWLFAGSSGIDPVGGSDGTLNPAFFGSGTFEFTVRLTIADGTIVGEPRFQVTW